MPLREFSTLYGRGTEADACQPGELSGVHPVGYTVRMYALE
jgi:hypothetical protein